MAMTDASARIYANELPIIILTKMPYDALSHCSVYLESFNHLCLHLTTTVKLSSYATRHPAIAAIKHSVKHTHQVPRINLYKVAISTYPSIASTRIPIPALLPITATEFQPSRRQDVRYRHPQTPPAPQALPLRQFRCESQKSDVR